MTSVVATRAIDIAPAEATPAPRVYFPALNHLRFVAAAGVVIHHLEQIKESFGFPNCMDLWITTAVGKEGVRLFFVLSGFLITYLLLLERDATGGLKVRSFYKRRILRIWPLYFLIVLASFVLMPILLDSTGLLPNNVSVGMHKLYENFLVKLALYCSFLPNLTVYMYEPVYGGGHLWTIAAEEQFYLMWPLLLVAFAKAPLLGFAAALSAKFGAIFALQHAGVQATSLGYAIVGCLESNGVESFVAGGVSAWLFLRYRTLMQKIVTNPLVITLGIVCIVVCMAHKQRHYVLLMNLSFAWLVLYQCTKSVRAGRINRWLQYLGTVSYGIYMYHPVVVFSVLTAGCLLPSMPAAAVNGIFYPVTFAATILVATISYEFFEKKFLKQKDKLAVIKSGNG